MPRRSAQLCALALCLFTFGCDHASKHAAIDWLSGRPAVVVVRGLFELRYAENRGIAFSLFETLEHAAKPWVLGIVCLIAALSLAGRWWQQRRASLPERAGYAMLVGGATANGVDRLIHGYVVDFLHVTGWPVFNVADIAVVVGGGLFLLAARRAPPEAKVPPG